MVCLCPWHLFSCTACTCATVRNTKRQRQPASEQAKATAAEQGCQAGKAHTLRQAGAPLGQSQRSMRQHVQRTCLPPPQRASAASCQRALSKEEPACPCSLALGGLGAGHCRKQPPKWWGVLEPQRSQLLSPLLSGWRLAKAKAPAACQREPGGSCTAMLLLLMPAVICLPGGCL